ncbi:hypothetical protein MRS76_17925 [Rhizobiaceae bacterium n13]|uniref:Uncharacterized protein n=1 Tax=Ferirhizobium litorale TaxID=2927786 RepID=A0AAE3QIK7_9HYPH|nr:hypothetical protein [Fererhizobium litorale]MDI7863834.1 hypothetical protein [Fererhizobium litorale]MDI7924066.1 hypothetical protein [Fererhizobium litorale]
MLSEGVDEVLIDQLKQLVCFMIFHGQILGKRLDVSTIYGRLSGLRRIFVAMKVTGLSSLSQVNGQTFPAVRTLFPPQMPGEVLAGLHAILMACQTGYVLDGITDFNIGVPRDPEPWDTSQIPGKEVLTDEEYGLLVRKVDFLFDNYNEYKKIVASVWRDQTYAPVVREWLLPEFPGVLNKHQPLALKHLSARLLQSASAFRQFLATGFRPNELLSTQRGFLVRHPTGMQFSEEHVIYEVVKNQPPGGVARSFPLDPVWEIEVVEDALEFVCDLYEKTGDRLFTGPKIDGEFSTGHLGTNLREFCRLAGIGFEATGYNLRATLISHTAQTLAGGLTQAQLAMDHALKRTTAGYALSSPSVRDDIYERCQEISQDRTITLLESAAVMGGPGLHGEQGRRIENDLARALDASSGVVTKKEVAEEFLEETLRRNIYPLPVMPGVFCFKTLQARGECSKASNDSLADVGRCSPRCPYGVQLEYRRDVVRHEIAEIIPNLHSQSDLRKSYWLRQILDQLVAFPDLEPELREALAKRPELLKLLDKLRRSK